MTTQLAPQEQSGAGGAGMAVHEYCGRCSNLKIQKITSVASTLTSIPHAKETPSVLEVAPVKKSGPDDRQSFAECNKRKSCHARIVLTLLHTCDAGEEVWNDEGFARNLNE